MILASVTKISFPRADERPTHKERPQAVSKVAIIPIYYGFTSAMATAETLASGMVTYTPGPFGWARDCVFYLMNNHLLLSVFFAHPLHPYPRGRRGVVLFNSLAFGFFITGTLHAFLPASEGVGSIARSTLQATIGTVLQLAFDVPASMFGQCPCAHQALPSGVQGFCRGVATCCLSLHTCAAIVLTLVSLLLLAFEGNRDEV